MEDRIAGRLAMLALPGITPVMGGVPIIVGGQTVGAVGISGLAPQQDHQVAEAGTKAVR
jgi:glc operon protein GlcG